ncbi:MAG: Anti-sigma B factor RsbT [uncultured Corynebacteriales bacterium]|uniref:Anti-sigma B factor RsbT n=1 Tax=uncultured Mycobacteriales bacterium TaxID=581187 RepID=A0A6J4JX60_9ACTN|nr:MAG: Anti-sigma B factor RsbT [uncultured Corynebacteriales bacterium]
MGGGDQPILDLVPIVRRVVGARIRDPHLVDDLVQETLARMMAARARIGDETLVPYAIVTAKNLVASHVQRQDRDRRKAHLVADPGSEPGPEDGVLGTERRQLVAEALRRLPAEERELLVAHEVQGAGTASLAAERGSTAGAIAAQLSRSRAKLRVEVLLAERTDRPPTDRCRPVLIALSSGDRRRQQRLDCAGHLLECDFCAALAPALLDRRSGGSANPEQRVRVTRDADVVAARQKGREVAAGVGFSRTDTTLVATVISELARNIVQFAERGEILVCPVEEPGRRGVMIVARDVGPGIRDLAGALTDGYSTYRGGLGLGLPGTRRLMDEFDIVSEVGKGTTVTTTKWLRDRPAARGRDL